MTQPPAGRVATGPGAPSGTSGDWSREDDVAPDSPTASLPAQSWGPSSQSGSHAAAGPDGQPTFTSTPLARQSVPPGPLVQGSAAPAFAAPPSVAAPVSAGAPGAPTLPAAGRRTEPVRPGATGAGAGAGAAGAGAGATGAAAPRGARRGPRRARLQLRHIDPWTVLKFSCVLAIALFFVWLIVVGVLYGVLDGAGIVQKVNDTVTTLQSGNAKPPITAKIVFGGAAIIGVVNIVLFIALTTVGSVVYNLCADLVGGIEITLSER